MGIREEEAHRAASLYYVQDQTMEAIARRMGVSRSSVSRLLTYAREIGLVRISLAPPPGSSNTPAGKLAERFGVRATVVPVGGGATEVARLDAVAKTAAGQLASLISDGTTLGVAWGNTTAEVVRRLVPHPVRGATVVQLNGAASATDTSIPFAGSILERAAMALDARLVQFPVPAFFDYAKTREAMWGERSVQRVLEIQRSCTVALFGVGAFESEVASHVYSGGYLTEEDVTDLRSRGVVGDICTVFLRGDGTYKDIPLNMRASGLPPHELRKVPRRLCVVSGQGRVAPTRAALAAGLITDLVVDDTTARALLSTNVQERGIIQK